MTNRGHFLELSIPTGDVQESLEFYLRLGFTELPVNDIRGHFYAVVTDGRVAIGLHADGFEEATLSFVWPDVARHVRELEDAGYELTIVELGIDEFHEAGMFSPDGHPLRFMEARTFSRQNFRDTPAPAIGRSAEITLRCADYRAQRSRSGNPAAFITDDDPGDDPDDGARDLMGAGRDAGTPQRLPLAGTGVAVRSNRYQTRRSRNWIAAALRIDAAAADRLVTAPEGTRLALVDDERQSKDD